MRKIIDPVDKELLKSQLTKEKFLRTTNHGGNEIYVVDNNNAPDVIREIGRLREEAFRAGGGGTGRELDIDKFDTDAAYGYKQLVLWDPEAERIIGGYRYVLCDDIVYDKYGQPILTSSHMFRFSKSFIRNYLEHTIELGRSFVTIDYQSSKGGAKSIFALDNLRQYPTPAREMIQVFLNKWFGVARFRRVRLVKPARIKWPFRYTRLLKGKTFKEDYRILKAYVSEYGVSIPPLVNSYMNLSPYMQYFGTGINDEFGDIYDSGILIPFKDMAEDKINRHVKTVKPMLLTRLRNLLRRK